MFPKSNVAAAAAPLILSGNLAGNFFLLPGRPILKPGRFCTSRRAARENCCRRGAQGRPRTLEDSFALGRLNIPHRKGNGGCSGGWRSSPRDALRALTWMVRVFPCELKPRTGNGELRVPQAAARQVHCHPPMKAVARAQRGGGVGHVRPSTRVFSSSGTRSFG